MGATVGTLLILELAFRSFSHAVPLAPVEQLQRATVTFPPGRAVGPCRAEESQPLGALVRSSPFTDIVYELKPDLDTCFQGGHVRTNHAGFRAGREYAVAKRSGTLRILGLGDSLMFGQGVSDEETYANKIEQQLPQILHRSVEFMNLAVPGYNTAIEAGVLQHRGMRYHPDVIVLHWCGNDFAVPYFLSQSATPPSLHQSALLAWLRQGLLKKQETQLPFGVRAWGDLVETPSAFINYAPDPAEIPDAYHWMIGFKGVTHALERIRALTVPAHIPVIVVANHFYNVYRPPWVLKQAFTNRGFTVVMVDHPKEHWLNAKDAHLNALGHDAHAKKIMEALVQLHVPTD